MYEKINELIEYYVTLRREDPANENEVYKWYAIAHFQQYWKINATDFYEMFKEAFREKNNLVDYRPFGILEALGENYPTKLKELLGIVYGADDFYTKLGKCRTFTENVIDDLKEKSNTNFSSKIDERTLSFLLTLKFPNEHTFYKRNIYTKLCEYLGEVSRKERKYEHFIELLTKITTYFNNPELKQLTSNFIPQGFDEPLLLAQDIVYQNMNKENEDPKRYWLYSPGEQAVKWEEFYNESIMAIGWDKLGNFENYTDRKSILEALINNYGGGEDQRNNVSAIDDFCNGENKINIGDIVIVKKGTKTLLGYGRVTSDYYYDESREEFLHCREVEWFKKGEWEVDVNLPRKTLTDVTTYNSDFEGIKYAQYLLNIMNGNTQAQEDNLIIKLLKYKPQIILQGPPGTGKTREAKRIAKALLGLGENDSLEGNEQFKLIQFHPSYSYEDFVRGIIAENTDGNISYVTKDKILAEFAKKALKDKDTPYVLIIDEINRGNVSAIFGELITLLEEDKRKGNSEHIEVKLPYSGDNFSVPNNVYIIGTMNTADRSVEALDTALRRRFSFVEMQPNPNHEDLSEVGDVKLKKLLKTINERIEVLIDKDHQIGHSYFIGIQGLEDLKRTFKDKIIPLLEEYFYGDFGKIGLVLGEKFIEQTKYEEKVFAKFPYEKDFLEDKKIYHITPSKDWDEKAFKSISARYISK